MPEIKQDDFGLRRRSMRFGFRIVYFATPLLITWGVLADSPKTKKKLASEAQRLISRVLASNAKDIDKLTKRLVELDEQGLPVRRLLCTAIATGDEREVKKAMAALEAISLDTATLAKELISFDVSSASNPMQVMQLYTDKMQSLQRENQLDPAVSPILGAHLRQVADFAIAAQKADLNSLSGGKSWNVYEQCLALIGKCAKDDDDAFGDILSFATIKVQKIDDYWQLRVRAACQAARSLANKPDRARAAVPIIATVLKEAVDPPIRMEGAAGVFGRSVADYSVSKLLKAIGDMGPLGQELAPYLMDLAQRPGYSKDASEAIAKIVKP